MACGLPPSCPSGFLALPRQSPSKLGSALATLLGSRLGHIARHKIPKYIFFVDSYPMTASGKIQKYKLKDIALDLLKKAGVTVV